MEILIFDPVFDQSIAIAKYLKKYGNCTVVGCMRQYPTGKLWRLNNYKYFDKIIVHDINKELLDQFPVAIPTNAVATSEFFELVETYKIGDVNFNRKNLEVSDKIFMLDLCGKLNIPIPTTYLPDDKIKNFPVFYKSRHESSNLKKLRGLAQKQSDLDNLPHKEIIIQEYIETPETFGVGFIADNGKITAYAMHKELLSYPKRGGSGVLLERINDERLLNYTLSLVKTLEYNGWGLAEFKYSPERNDFVFMEINAKFWASFEFTLLCNPLFGKYLLGLDYPNVSVKYMTFTHRLLVTNIFRIIKHLPQIVVSYKTKSGNWRKVILEILNHWAGKLIEVKN